MGDSFTATGKNKITNSNNNKYIVEFLEGNGSIEFAVKPTSCNYVVVGGGGSGGLGTNLINICGGGGGGGGQVKSDVLDVEINKTYNVVVGSGGLKCTTENNGTGIENTDQTKSGRQVNYGFGGESKFNNITSNGGTSGEGSIYNRKVQSGQATGGSNGGGNGSYQGGPSTNGQEGTTIVVFDKNYILGSGGGGGGSSNDAAPKGGTNAGNGDFSLTSTNFWGVATCTGTVDAGVEGKVEGATEDWFTTPQQKAAVQRARQHIQKRTAAALAADLTALRASAAAGEDGVVQLEVRRRRGDVDLGSQLVPVHRLIVRARGAEWLLEQPEPRPSDGDSSDGPPKSTPCACAVTAAGCEVLLEFLYTAT